MATTKKRPTEAVLREEYLVKDRSAMEIGKDYGVSDKTIYRMLSAAKIKPKRLKHVDNKPTDDELYTDYILDRLSMKQMVEKYKTPESIIWNWISDAELSRRTNHLITSEEALAMLKEYESNRAVTISYLAKRHDITMSKVSRRLKRGREIKAELEKKGMVMA